MKNRITSIIWGFCLICFGIGIAGNAAGTWKFTIFFDGWWTLFIILPCIGKIASGTKKVGAWIGLTIGVLLLMASREWIPYENFWKVLFPTVFIFLGIQLVLEYSNFWKKYKTIISAVIFLFILGWSLSIGEREPNSIEEIDSSLETFLKTFSEEEIEGILIKAGNLYVELQQGKNFEIEAFEVTEQFEVVIEDKILKVTQNSDNLFQDFFQNTKQQAKVRITVPITVTLEKSNFICGSGKLTVDGLRTKMLTLTGGSGDIYLKNLTVQEKTELTTNSGTTVLEEVELYNAKITTGSGNFSLNGSLRGENQLKSGSGNTVYALLGTRKDYEIDGKGGSGDIWFNGEKFSSFKVKGKNQKHSISIFGGSGRVVIDFREDIIKNGRKRRLGKSTLLSKGRS